jgi:uncharacterized protein (TIGR02145 family)
VKTVGEYCFPLVYGNAIKNGVANTAAYTKVEGQYSHNFVNHLDNVITDPYIANNEGCVPHDAELSMCDTNLVFDRITLAEGIGGKYVRFSVKSVPETGANGVVSVIDANGVVMWSWHIWVTDQPEEHIYPDDAGVMMDRNLGATSAIPGDVGALGLFYEWGRKDPFPNQQHGTTIYFWPGDVGSDKYYGTIEYAISHPMTFISKNNNGDWLYSTDSRTDDTRWTTSNESKSIYDPCPLGWRVPDGGPYGVWARALGSSKRRSINDQFKDLDEDAKWNLYNWYVDFSDEFGDYSRIVYTLETWRDEGDYWSATPEKNKAYSLHIEPGYVEPSFSKNNLRANAHPIRCIKE